MLPALLALVLVPPLPISRVTSDLVGSYYKGDGLGVNWSLDLRQDGSFSFEWQGCLGTYDQEAGRWRSDGDLVYLDGLKRKGELADRSIPAVLRPVQWGSRHYLVGSDGMLDFCNLINQGTEPRSEAHGLALLRQKDWTQQVGGMPNLPSDWRHLLLSKPVRGNILRALGSKRAEVNRGTQHGLRPGMKPFSQGPALVSYKIVSTSSERSVVEVLYGETTPSSGAISTLLYDPTLRPRCGER
jgi:hypothetical protein